MTYLDLVLGVAKAAYQDGPVPGDLAGARNATDMSQPAPAPTPKPLPSPTPRPTPTQADILRAREGAVPGDLQGAASAADVARPKPSPTPTPTPSPTPSKANVQPALAPRPQRPLNPAIEPMEKKKTPLDLPYAKAGMTQGHRLAAAMTAKVAFDLGAVGQQMGDWAGQVGNAIADYKPLAEKNVPINMMLAGLGGAGIGALTGGKKHKMRNALLGALMASGAAGLGTYAARDHVRGIGREQAPQLPGWIPGSSGINTGLQRLTGGLTDEAMDNHLTNEMLWNKLRGVKAAAESSDGTPRAPLLADVVGALLGGKMVKEFNPAARGKIHGWHGSTPENMERMRREGIKTMGEMAEQGKSTTKHILEHQGGDAWQKSKDMAFVGPKGVAKTFVATAGLGKRPMPRDGQDPLEFLLSPEFKEHAAKARAAYFRNIFKSPLRVEIPFDQAHRVVSNPEYDGIIRKLRERVPEGWASIIKGVADHFPGHPIKKIRKSPGVLGGIKPEWIAGGNGFKYVSGSGIKAAPLRALGGGIGTLLGAGVLGSSLWDIKNHLVRE